MFLYRNTRFARAHRKERLQHVRTYRKTGSTFGGDGTLIHVTPESAGWQYVGFQVVQLAEGQSFTRESGDQELCIVLLSGLANISTPEHAWENVGKRMSIFEKIPPYSVYVSNSDQVEIKALSAMEIAICAAPGKGTYPARLITPEDVGVETRGYGNLERQIHNILPEQKEADSLLVVEVFTPDGHWSSYPPHKHDRDALPEESLLEETYYFRVQPEQGLPFSAFTPMIGQWMRHWQ